VPAFAYPHDASPAIAHLGTEARSRARDGSPQRPEEQQREEEHEREREQLGALEELVAASSIPR
jgi:hypothetical protein